MRPPSRRDLALGIALLARRIPQDDAVHLKVRDWFDSPTGSLRDALGDRGLLGEDELALAEQAAVRLLERDPAESAGCPEALSTLRDGCGSSEPSLPLFDDALPQVGQAEPESGAR